MVLHNPAKKYIHNHSLHKIYSHFYKNFAEEAEFKKENQDFLEKDSVKYFFLYRDNPEGEMLLGTNSDGEKKVRVISFLVMDTKKKHILFFHTDPLLRNEGNMLELFKRVKVFMGSDRYRIRYLTPMGYGFYKSKRLSVIMKDNLSKVSNII